MLKVKLYAEDQAPLMAPCGKLETAEDIATEFPAVKYFPHMLTINGNVCQAVQEFAAMRSFHGVPEEMTDTEALAFIEEKINTPPVVEPSAEERIAAAMEYQNLMNL